MIYLHKILPLLVSPLAIAFALIVYGAWTSRKLVFATVAAMYLLSTPVVSKHLLARSKVLRSGKTPPHFPKPMRKILLHAVAKGNSCTEECRPLLIPDEIGMRNH